MDAAFAAALSASSQPYQLVTAVIINLSQDDDALQLAQASCPTLHGMAWHGMTAQHDRS